MADFTVRSLSVQEYASACGGALDAAVGHRLGLCPMNASKAVPAISFALLLLPALPALGLLLRGPRS